MRSFTVKISDLNGAAFEEDASVEIASILRDLASVVEEGRSCGGVRDTNGNLVGYWEFVK